MSRAMLVSMSVMLAMGCASVERQYQNAVRSRDEDRIRSFIHRHPESPLVMDAATVLDTVRFENAVADTGIVSLQRFLQTYPTSRLAPSASIVLAGRVRDMEIARLSASVELDPKAPVMVELARLHRERGDTDVADSLYRRAVALDPDDAGAHTGLALSYLERGMTDEADREIEAAQNLAPTDEEVVLAAGEYYRLVGRPDLAISSFQKALNASPNSVSAHTGLGLLYLDIGQNRNAVWEFLRIRELDPKNVSSLYYLGVAYADQGDGVTAMRYLENYLGAPHTADDAENLEKAQMLYDRLKGEVRSGDGLAGGVVADPNNPTAAPSAKKPDRAPSQSGRMPVGAGVPGQGFGRLGRGGGARKGP